MCCSPPGRGSKAAVVSGYREKGEFLQSEAARYSAYTAALESLVGMNCILVN